MKKKYIVPESVCAQVYGDAVLLVESPGDGSGDKEIVTESDPTDPVEEDDVLVKGLRW